MSKKANTTKVRFTAEIESPDGSVVKKTVEVDSSDIPTMEDFDLSTKEGFLRDFDAFEKAVLKARNQAGEEIASAFLDEVGKKNDKQDPEAVK